MIRRGTRRSSILSSFPIVIGIIIVLCIVLNEVYVFSSASGRSNHHNNEDDEHEVEEEPGATRNALVKPPAVDVVLTVAPVAEEEPNMPLRLPPPIGRQRPELPLEDFAAALDAQAPGSDSSSSAADNAPQQATATASTTSPYTMRPWKSYEDLTACPRWAFGDSDVEGGTGEPWMNPIPRTAIHHFGGSNCRAVLGAKVRVVFTGLRGKSGYSDDEEMDKIMNWRDRESLRRDREEHHNELISELRLQLRCRISGIDVTEVDEEEGGNGDGTAKFIFHPMPKDEVKSAGLHAAHKLEVSDGSVSVWAGTREAVAHAVTALLYLFLDKNISSSYGSTHSSFQWMSMPPVDLSRHRSGTLSLVCGGYDGFDGAALSYRGLLVDVARHFLRVEELLRVMHVMSLLKMNVLHLHLSDDQGWRLAMPDFPELSTFGARRGPNVNPKSSKYAKMNIRHNIDDVPEEYSLKDTRLLRQAARLLHITLIPEIDVPAHSAALLRAADAARATAAGHHVVGTSQDEGVVAEVQGLGKLHGVVEVHEGCVENTTAAACSSNNMLRKCSSNLAVNCMGGTHGLIVPTKGSVDIVQHLLDVTLKRHFPQSPYVHLGGDETVQFRESSIMTSAVRDELAEMWGDGEAVTLAQAHQRFLSSLRNYVERQHYRSSIIWDDSVKAILSATPARASVNAPVASEDAFVTNNHLPVVQWWRDWHEDGRWEKFRAAPVLKILSPTTSTYLDASQHTSRAEDMYPVQDGTVTVDHVWALAEKLGDPTRDRVLGVEGCLWSEALVNTTVLWYQLMPRLAVLANVAWSGGELASKQTREAMMSSGVFERSAAKLQAHVNGTLQFTPLVLIR